MPPLKVRDKITGKVDTIDWSGSRPPTRSEVLKALEQQRGRKPSFGGNVDEDYGLAPMPVQPNAGKSNSGFFSSLSHIPYVTEAPQSAKDEAARWGNEFTTPKLNENPWMARAKGFIAGAHEGATSLMNLADLGSIALPESKATNLLSLGQGIGNMAEGYNEGAPGKTLLGLGQAALSARGAIPKAPYTPPKIVPAEYRARVPLGLPERSEVLPRFAVDETGLATDLTRPTTHIERRPTFDPRDSIGPSGNIDPSTGVVKRSKDQSGRWLEDEIYPHKPTEQWNPKTRKYEVVDVPSPTIKTSELPVIDISPEVQSAYPPRPMSDRARYPGVTAPGSEKPLRGARGKFGAEDTRKLSPTGRERSSPIGSNKEEIPVTNARRIGETRDQYRARIAGGDPTSQAAKALLDEAATNPTTRVKSAAEALKSISDDAVTSSSPSGLFDRAREWNKAKGEKGSLNFSAIFGSDGPKVDSPILTREKPSIFTQGGRKRIQEEAISAGNAPRAIMASVDLSAPLRQGATMIHKPEFWKALPAMVKSMGSEESFHALQHEIAARPNIVRYKKSKLALTDLTNANKREELFMSKAAEHIPVIGPLIRASGRGYVGFLNKLRADTFDSLVDTASKAGIKTSDKAIAEFINNATGRGDLGKAERYAPALNAMFFSPRLMASRVNMLSGRGFLRGDAFTRKEYIKSMAAFGATASTALGLAKIAGADVETDPRSSDFGKIKVGNTRMDIGAGFLQYIRTGAQLMSNSVKDLETGKIKELGQGYRGRTRKDVLESFLAAKASPIASLLYTNMTGRTFTGEKVQNLPDTGKMVDLPSTAKELSKSEFTRRVMPMIISDLSDLYEEDPDLMWMGIPTGFGVGLNVQKKRQVKRPQ